MELILILIAILWAPFLLMYFITSIATMCVGIKWLFSKLPTIAESLCVYLDNNILGNEKYLKFATISSVVLFAIMFILSIFR